MNLETHIAGLAVRRPYATAAILAAIALLCVAVIALRIRVDSDVLNLLPQRFDSVRTLKVYDREFTQARELAFVLLDENHTADMEAFADSFGEALRKEPWVVRVLDRSPMDSPDGSRQFRALSIPLLFNLEPSAAHR